jgi:serine protease Do
LALEVPFGDYINEIDKGSPAEKAGLKKWDVVLKVDKTSMKNYLVMDIIQNKIPWDVIELEIFRDWKIKNITVKLDILPWKKLISE